jgi:hypothetical protein
VSQIQSSPIAALVGGGRDSRLIPGCGIGSVRRQPPIGSHLHGQVSQVQSLPKAVLVGGGRDSRLMLGCGIVRIWACDYDLLSTQKLRLTPITGKSRQTTHRASRDSWFVCFRRWFGGLVPAEELLHHHYVCRSRKRTQRQVIRGK